MSARHQNPFTQVTTLPSLRGILHPSPSPLNTPRRTDLYTPVYDLQLILVIRGPFAKFMDSPYYSEPEPCGGAVTVSFSKHLTWQATHFLQRSIHFSETCCRPLITSRFLASELPFLQSLHYIPPPPS
jgi:hypothetical protein